MAISGEALASIASTVQTPALFPHVNPPTTPVFAHTTFAGHLADRRPALVASSHLRSFVQSNPHLVVHAILQRNTTPSARGKPASSARDDFSSSDVKVYSSPDDFFADKEMELVVVATGHDSHKELAIRALRAGKHGESREQQKELEKEEKKEEGQAKRLGRVLTD